MSASWMPHGYCFLWERWVLVGLVSFNALIALTYFVIGGCLTIFSKAMNSKVNLELTKELRQYAFKSFMTFIVACAMTHLMDIVVIWYPQYGLQMTILGVTAVFSSITAFFCIKIAGLWLEAISKEKRNVPIR